MNNIAIDNAKKAAEIGCAYNLKNDKFTADGLRSYCQDLVERKSFHTNLEKYSLEIQRLGGRRKAAEIVMQEG